MRLADIKGTYQAIFSLGDLCLISIQLEKNNLRPSTGPLDWMASFRLRDVSRLLANRFAGFMDRNHLVVEKQISDALYLVSEKKYNLLINHDFFTHNNSPDNLAAYPAIKAKYDQRVQRFLHKCQTCPKILFIRTEGTLEEVEELQRVLSGLVAYDFNILLINHSNEVQTIVENPFPLEKVCSLQLPETGKWDLNDRLWAFILSGIHLDEA